MGARRALQAGGHPSCIPPAPPATHMPPPRPQTMHCRSPELPDDSRQWVPNRADARAFDVCILTATGCILRSRSAAHVKPRAQIMSSPLASDAKAQTLYRLSLGAREGISRCKGVCGVARPWGQALTRRGELSTHPARGGWAPPHGRDALLSSRLGGFVRPPGSSQCVGDRWAGFAVSDI